MAAKKKTKTDIDPALAKQLEAVRTAKGTGTTSATIASAAPGEGGPLHGTAVHRNADDSEKRAAKIGSGKNGNGKNGGNKNRDGKNGTTPGPVGSDPSAARHFADANDFGIAAADATKRMSASDEAKNQPEGDHQTDPRAGRSTGDGERTTGVGGNSSGVGSSSGGDVDTDIIGFGGDGGTISQSGPDDRQTGPDMTDGSPDTFSAKAPHAPGIEPGRRRKPDHGVVKPQDMQNLKGTTVDRSGGDVSTTASGLGSGTTSVGFDTGDDASAGEISQGEAGGDDNADS